MQYTGAPDHAASNVSTELPLKPTVALTLGSCANSRWKLNSSPTSYAFADSVRFLYTMMPCAVGASEAKPPEVLDVDLKPAFSLVLQCSSGLHFSSAITKDDGISARIPSA